MISIRVLGLLVHVFAKLGVPNRVALAPWFITRSSDVFATCRQHNRSQQRYAGPPSPATHAGLSADL